VRFKDGSERYNTGSEYLDEIIHDNEVDKCAFGEEGKIAVVLEDGRMLWNFEAGKEFEESVERTLRMGGIFKEVTMSERGHWFIRGEIDGKEMVAFGTKGVCLARKVAT